MRIQATTKLFVLRHLSVAILLLIPLVSASVFFTAQAASQQVLAEQSTSTPTVTTVAPAAEAQPEPTPAAEAPAPVPTPAPAPVAATPAPAVDRLSMPSIGINSPFVTVGLASNGAVDVHPSLVGWWNGSAQPGSNGAAFFDGHTPGALSALAGISTGASFSVQKANGQTYNYTVVYKEVVPLSSVDMKKALTVYGGASEGLNLMTCAGTYIPSLGTTDHRLIVYAVRS